MRNPFVRSRATLDQGTISTATKRLDGLVGQEATTARRQQKLQQAWQEEAFTYADLLGEVKYAYRYIGKAMGKLRPYPAILDPNDQDKLPTAIEDYRVDADPDNGVEGTALPPDLIAAAQAEVARVRDSQGNSGPILRRLGENLFIVGEGYLVGVPDEAGGETWAAHSISELAPSKTKDGAYELKTDPAAAAGLLPEEAKVIRIWSPHPKWGDLADSSMRGALDTCDELLTLSRSIRGTAMSRLAGAGLLALAQELSFSNPNAASAAKEDSGDPLSRHVMETMMTPISDPASAAAAVPLILRVPSDMIKDKSWADHMIFERTIDEQMAQQRNELRTVLAIDLDIPPEQLTGKADSNHWTAWQIDEDTFKGHVEPDAQLIFDAWTTSLLRPALLEKGFDPELVSQILVWYDATALVIRPNRSEDADKAFDRFAISWDAYRGAKGFTRDDAPSDEEVDARVKIAAAQKGKPEESVPNGSGTSDSTSPPAQTSSISRAIDLKLAAAVAGRGGLTHLGVRLQRIDADLRSKLLAAADSAMRRSMEKAGVKIKSKVSGRGTNGNRYGSFASAIAGAPPDRICTILGRGIVEQLGFSGEELVGDQFNSVGDQFDTWVADSQERTRNLLADVGVSAAAIATMKNKHDTDRAAARDTFVDSLGATAQDRLYSTTPADQDKGEFTGTLVKMSLVRVALAVAGGAHSSEGRSGLTPAGLPVLSGEPPALGVANGSSTLDALDSADIGTDRYEWVYGISTRSFEPHAALDGAEFEAWDDDVLTNGDSWPPVPYFMPGDHDGCMCDAVPTYVSTADARPDFNPSGEPLEEQQVASAGRTQ